MQVKLVKRASRVFGLSVLITIHALDHLIGNLVVAYLSLFFLDASIGIFIALLFFFCILHLTLDLLN